MPLHEYRCEKCGVRVEKLVRSIHREIPVVNCPECGERMERKVGKIAGWEFKGVLA